MNIPHRPQRSFLGTGKLAALVKVQFSTSGLLMTAYRLLMFKPGNRLCVRGAHSGDHCRTNGMSPKSSKSARSACFKMFRSCLVLQNLTFEWQQILALHLLPARPNTPKRPVKTLITMAARSACLARRII